jgi:uncharacterized cupin superfamily protein
VPQKNLAPILATAIEPRGHATIYPPPYAARVAGRTKQRLGDHFGIAHFGVNLTTLLPGGQSALLHRHSQQEEFVYILAGTATLRTGTSEQDLTAGMCIGFCPDGPAHHLLNRTSEVVQYLEIGDRPAEDAAAYPEDDLAAHMVGGAWHITRRDGSPLEEQASA